MKLVKSQPPRMLHHTTKSGKSFEVLILINHLLCMFVGMYAEHPLNQFVKSLYAFAVRSVCFVDVQDLSSRCNPVSN